MNGSNSKGAVLRKEMKEWNELCRLGEFVDNVAKWQQVIEYLWQELPRRHINLYFARSREDVIKELRSLCRSLPDLHDNEIKVALACWLASFQDAHTKLHWLPEKLCPLQLYWFEEGIFVTSAAPEYNCLVNKELVSINGKNLEDLLPLLSRVISHENDMWLKRCIPQFLIHLEVLHGLRIAPTSEEVSLTLWDPFSDKGENLFVKTVRAVTMNQAGDWDYWSNSGSGFLDKSLKTPLYLKNRDKFYWFSYLLDCKTVYFQYNDCRNDPVNPIDDFIGQLIGYLKKEPVEKLVVDLRHNNGGDSDLLLPFIREIKLLAQVNRPGGLYVLIGRDTFSSALLNALQLRATVNAIFVGEPTGGKPNANGDIGAFDLPGTNHVVTYSKKYFRTVKSDPPSLMPDCLRQLSFADYISGRDSVLEHILSGQCLVPWRLLSVVKK